jgi:hypothetical protein
MTDLERLKAYDDELSKVMPPDFKDWWQNSKDEWPDIASWVITNLRERLEESERQLDYAYEELENRV